VSLLAQDLLEFPNQVWKINLQYIPQDVEINQGVAVDQDISRANHLAPWYFWVRILHLLCYMRCCLTNNLDQALAGGPKNPISIQI